ncbi:MAG: DNA gyrase subunit A [Candidatus Eisenbacteria bacterium]|uniref:DNA gyrase subunit A n=1 Tax=Eiseniibacteriota bacterium TaxID=2212470 RepID=A0A538T6L6_UNCEI|nr:MAG: DNA gyrase subunit A [Candidatus Eisenbacteria bacterium]
MATREKVVPIYVEDEMRNSYIDYSMSVIISRALPDVRDGLKPVHRRILVAMRELNLLHDRPFRKSAKITGDVTGNYHPHGTAAVYETMVRMAQTFSMRYPLVDGQGNFGSVDGDAPAAERYTEARLTEFAEEMLRDIERDTVGMRPNYDESREEPVVLPAGVPNLLVNGSAGIAVGMATNVPPHNLREIVDAIHHVIDHPDCEVDELLSLVQGPDFPTGGVIYGRQGVQDCYRTGRGHITVRSRATIEEIKKDREAIIVSEIPYMVSKAALLEKIADLVKDGPLDGISDLRDESDREGMRIVIELKRDAQPKVVLNQLFKHTQMQTTFGANMLALVGNRPLTLTLKEMIEHYIAHRRDVVVRRTRFDLAEAERRAHILEGLKIALDHIDEIVALIRAAADTDGARTGLMSRFGLSEVQANAILEMRLSRLTGLERQKVEDEYLEVIQLIDQLKAILESPAKVLQIIKDELAAVRERFGDERRTEIVAGSGEFEAEDLIAEEDMVITISHAGYIKRLPVTTYRSQRRGGRGVTGAGTREEDFIEHLFIASTHSYILVFTDRGRVYWLKVHEVPQGGRTAKGKAIVNMVEMSQQERVASVLPVKEFQDTHFIMMCTARGTVKKTPLSAYSNPRRGGIVAIGVESEDSLIDAVLTDGSQDIILQKRNGKAIRFNEQDVRPMGRTAYGVRGVTLEEDDAVVGMIAVKREAALLVATENGYGKRSPISDYRITGRGGKGIISIQATERNGRVVAALEVIPTDQVMLITRGGIVIRTKVSEISEIGRNTQGVRLINLEAGDQLIDVAKVEEKDEGEEV